MFDLQLSTNVTQIHVDMMRHVSILVRAIAANALRVFPENIAKLVSLRYFLYCGSELGRGNLKERR